MRIQDGRDDLRFAPNCNRPPRCQLRRVILLMSAIWSEYRVPRSSTLLSTLPNQT